MTRTELIACMAKDTGISKSKAGAFLQAFTDALATEVQTGGSVAITGFGTFSLKETAARQGRNPRTGETIQIAAQRSVKFSVGKVLKDALNEGDKDESDGAAEETPVKAVGVEKTQKAAKEEPSKKNAVVEPAGNDFPPTATRFCRNWWTTYWV